VVLLEHFALVRHQLQDEGGRCQRDA
jgi:hypothetical protein